MVNNDKNKLKIVMLCEFYSANLEYQENLLTKYYTKHGYAVTVITSTFDSVFNYYAAKHNKNAPEEVFFDGSAKIIRLRYRFNLLNKIRIYTSIKNILIKEKPDLIYVHDIIPNILEAVDYMKSNSNCKMIMDYHADYSNSGKSWVALRILHGTLRKWYLDRARRYISKIFPVVPAGLVFLNEIYKVPYEAMEVLPLGADVDLCKEIRNSGRLTSLKEKYNIDKEAKVIVTGGKLSSRKKTELLIQAFDQLDIDNKHLIIIGDSGEGDADYKEKLLAMVNVIKNVHFVGWLSREEVYAHFLISTMAVFPASQSILWQQAIASGLPLLVGNTGGQSIEYLNLYKNIIILKKTDIEVEPILTNMQKVLMDDILYEEMRQGAEKVAGEQLDWNQLIYRTLRYNLDEKDM